MKTKLLLLAISAAAFASCSTMYKTGQTPDDVYYSPARPAAAATDDAQYVTTPQASPGAGNNYYSGDDRAIRMGITDYRYRYLNNDYDYSPYDFSFSYGHGIGNYYANTYYNPYYSNILTSGYYYNPYYSAYPVYVSPSGPLKNTTPRMANLNAYGTHYSNANGVYQLSPHPSGGTYNNTNTPTHRTGSGLGNLLNRVLVPAASTNNINTSTPANNNTTRTYTPPPASSASSSSSSSSSHSSSGGSISRPH